MNAAFPEAASAASPAAVTGMAPGRQDKEFDSA
jgi:hypothetical protein